MTAVLVVDDDPRMLQALRITLNARGYQVATAADGRSALVTASEQEPDIIVLDLGLPDLEGVEVILALRSWTTAPIVVLSGRAGSTDKIEALDAGADDYVIKPFRVDELLARLRAVVRRASPPSPSSQPMVVPFGHHLIDLDARRVVRRPYLGGQNEDGQNEGKENKEDVEVRLTPTEWHVLEVLVRNPEKLLTHRDLLPPVGGPAPGERSHYLRQYIARLRRKLEPDPARPRHLITESGMGYRFQP